MRRGGSAATSRVTLSGMSSGKRPGAVSTHVRPTSGRGERVCTSARPTWPAPQIQNRRALRPLQRLGWLETQGDGPAAALAEAGAERDCAFQRVRCLGKHRAGLRHRLPFQRAAADGSGDPVCGDEHLRARLPRGGAPGGDDGDADARHSASLARARPTAARIASGVAGACRSGKFGPQAAQA